MKHNKINKSLFTLLTWFLLQAAGTFAFAESIEPANGSNGEQIPTGNRRQTSKRTPKRQQASCRFGVYGKGIRQGDCRI